MDEASEGRDGGGIVKGGMEEGLVKEGMKEVW